MTHDANACGCVATDHPGAAPLSPEAALELLLKHARPPTEIVELPLNEALGRVLASPLISPIQVPPWDNSAMDGYALRGADLAPGGGRLRVGQRIPAGAVGMPLAPGSAARIFTGAPVPPGADTVVIQEVCRRDGDQLILDQTPAPGANIRRAGEDIAIGQEVIAAGTRLRPQHLGLAASVGTATLPVYRRLRVAVLSSGAELVMPGQPLGPGQIYNSNQFTLMGLLHALGCEVETLGIVDDTLEATEAALTQGAAQADLVIASGGVSVGEEDHVKPAVERLGRLDLWKIALRPGKPLAFGHIGDTPFIGTPGNPVSLFVTFLLFARPFILRCQGVDAVQTQALSGRAAFDWPKADKRREFVRARLRGADDGLPWIDLYPSRSSAVLSSVAWATGLAVIPEGRTLKRGDTLPFLPFSELLA